MVKKLYKHEFMAWLRIMPFFFVIPLVTAGFHRILQLFEADSVVYEIVSGSTILLFIVTLFVCLSAPTVYGIVRFYKNLFTGEGYLSFTLPVKNTTHLWVKTLTNLVFHVAAFLACIASFLVITSGEELAEHSDSGIFLWKMLPAEDCYHVAGFFAEFCVLMLASILFSILLFYSCLCIGQLAKKNRILLSVGVYFAYYVISQICSTVFMIFFSILSTSGALDSVFVFVEEHPYAFTHITFGSSILIYVVMALVLWLVCRFILQKKLNLE